MNQLDQTIKEQHVEMEQRIKKLDNNVRKNELEVQERTKQVHITNGKVMVLDVPILKHFKV